MQKELSNAADAVGNYNEIPTTISSDVLVVLMIDGLTITKDADKKVWADGELTYTITVKNQSPENYASVVVTDKLDTTLISFVESSVTINGAVATDKYAYNDGTLTINVGDIAASGESVITFKVSKA